MKFWIPGPPRGKGRPRFVRATGGTYTPRETVSYENLVKVTAMEAMGGAEKLQGPVRGEITIHLCPAASWSKKRQERALRGLERPTRKPDLDNYLKLVLDACNQIVYLDDKQVVEVAISKHYACHEGVSVVFTPLTQGG